MMKNLVKIPVAHCSQTFGSLVPNVAEKLQSNTQPIDTAPNSFFSDSPEADTTDPVARLERLEFSDTAMDRRNAPTIVTVCDLGELSESGESTCTSPFLTPASSTTSLRTLYTEAESLSKFTITYSESGHRISSELESQNIASQSTLLPQVSREANDKGTTLNSTSKRIVGDKSTRPAVAANHKGASRTRNSLCKHARENIGRCQTCSYGIRHWNPAEEIRKAQCRFERHGKKTPVTAVDEERGNIRARLMAANHTGSRSCQIRIKGEIKRAESKDEIPWWTWLASALTTICPARIDRLEREDTAMRAMPGGFRETNCVEAMTPSPAAVSSG